MCGTNNIDHRQYSTSVIDAKYPIGARAWQNGLVKPNLSIANHSLLLCNLEEKQEHKSTTFNSTKRATEPEERQICYLATILVSMINCVEIPLLLATTRSRAPIAKARQIAIYLSHTMGSVSYISLAKFYGRDRTTIAHACRVVEDWRDIPEFDLEMENFEDKFQKLMLFRNGSLCR